MITTTRRLTSPSSVCEVNSACSQTSQSLHTSSKNYQDSDSGSSCFKSKTRTNTKIKQCYAENFMKPVSVAMKIPTLPTSPRR
jgi:hypothetical protein